MGLFRLLIYSAISTLCFIEAKTFPSFPIGMFFVFAPLLAIADYEKQTLRSIAVCVITVLSFSLIELFVTQTNIYGAFYFFISCLILLASFRVIRKSMKYSIAFLSLILFGLSIDFLNLNVDQIDNNVVLAYSFANVSNWIQWYGYTGLLGGTFWIMVVNLLCFMAFFLGNPIENNVWRWRTMVLILIALILPILISNQIIQQMDFEPVSAIGTKEPNWDLIIASENPKNAVTSMMNNYGEYLGRTAVWLSVLILLSLVVRLKTKG